MKIGLIVNPIAGVGGPAGLKGSDGTLAAEALDRGAAMIAGQRATAALAALDPAATTILTCTGAMGQDAATAAGLRVETVYQTPPATSADDTRAAACALARAGAELILFAGGDGTARDMLAAIGRRVPVIGVPSGVKMHSAIFATSPRTAGMLAAVHAARPRPLVPCEVIDRLDDGSIHLFGTLLAPQGGREMQGAKAAGPSDDAMLAGACDRIARTIARDGGVSIIGGGMTMLAIKQALGIDPTLLGIDVVRGDRLIAKDADRATLLSIAQAERARLVLGVIGGQGFLIGRGNQQIGPDLLRLVPRDRIVVVASMSKLAAIAGGRLLVDSGDPALDRDLAGHMPVQVGGSRTVMMRVDAA
jgi:predicted polyphosphate/ATP-dependent NAD kinase